MQISKSDYIRFLQCQKYFWLQKKSPEILPEDNGSRDAIFEAGYEVEGWAYKLFPDGVDAGDKKWLTALRNTDRLIKNKQPAIFQASITGKDIYCRSDIITYNKELKALDIIEVKSTTQVYDIHYDDLSFQKLCFEAAGLKVGKLYLMHVNNQYIKNGEINPHELFIKVDVSEEVKAKEEDTKAGIKAALEALRIIGEPEITILRQCKNPYECPFIPHCYHELPEHSIYSIGGALGAKKLAALIDEGIIEVKDIPPELLTSSKLKKHHHAVKHDKIHIEKENIEKELEKIKYPIYYLDYETYSPAVPVIDGYRPHQKIVFQYSLHIEESPGAELKHYYFLAKDLKDPTADIAGTLQDRIAKDGSVIAWNMGFEKGCNTEMGERAPEFQAFFEDINNRMYDLMQVFKKGYYVHKEFHGSASLKKVLPVVVPELSYNELDIGDGMLASNTWGDMVSGDMSKKEKDKIYNDLLEYCELDTLAMVRILEKLNKVIKYND